MAGLMECTAEGETARPNPMTHALSLSSPTVLPIMVTAASFSLMRHHGTFQTNWTTGETEGIEGKIISLQFLRRQ